MKKLLKFLKWSAIVLLGTPVLIYLIWVAGNLRNDELNPEITKLLAQRPAGLAEKDNAYFDTIGLAAPANTDSHAWGLAWFTQAAANDRAFLENKPDTPVKLAGYPFNSKQIDLPCAKKEPKLTCLDEIALNPDAAQKHLERESLLLQRFDAVLDKDYREPYREASFKSEISPKAPESRAANLARIRFALEVSRGRDSAALNRWQRETAFILRQAQNSYTLIDAMVFTAALNRHQKLLADYISKHPQAARSRARQILAMQEPFNRSALTLRPAFESEAVFATRSLLAHNDSLLSNSLPGEESTPIAKLMEILASPLFDPQATANELTAQNLEYARIVTLEGNAFREALSKMGAKQDQEIGMSTLIHYHNPVGKILLASAFPDFSKYIFRSTDILANKQLMVFAIDLLSRNITSSKQIIEEINTRHAELRHPYTGELPAWDEKERTLSYPMREEEKGSIHAPLVIKLGTV